MPSIKWTPAQADAARECERLFQNGGPRVYVRDHDGRLRSGFHSAKGEAEIADPGQVVYSRRKQPSTGRYEWMQHAPAQAAADLPATIDRDKLRAVADCLVAGIIESLAGIHGCSVAQVKDGLAMGHPS